MILENLPFLKEMIFHLLNLGNRQPATLFNSSEFKTIIDTEGSVININSSLLSKKESLSIKAYFRPTNEKSSQTCFLQWKMLCI